MPFCTHSRLTESLAVCLIYSIVLLLLVPASYAHAVVRKPSKLSSQSGQLSPHRSNEVLVRFRAGTSQADKDVAAASSGAHLKKKLKGESAIETFELNSASDPLTAALQLNQNPAVEFAEPNFIVKSDQVTDVPNDPRFAEQWALKNDGRNGGQYGSDISAIGAWNSTTGNASTVIAVVDSGIDFNHPDLVNN